jgi:hypothetical protein
MMSEQLQFWLVAGELVLKQIQEYLPRLRR